MADLPLRPKDGGIDWDERKISFPHRTMHISTAIKREKESVAATLERVARWHDEREQFFRKRATAYEQIGKDVSAGFAKQETEFHAESADAIRAMKP